MINDDNLKLITLTSKSKIDDDVDFLTNQYEIINKDLIPIIGTIYIDDKLLCRLDIIYQQQYNTMIYFDLFLKFNNIDDAFGVSIGTKILLPDLFALKSNAKLIKYEGIELSKERVYINNNHIQKTMNMETATTTRSILKNRGKGYKIDSGNGKIIF